MACMPVTTSDQIESVVVSLSSIRSAVSVEEGEGEHSAEAEGGVGEEPEEPQDEEDPVKKRNGYNMITYGLPNLIITQL